MELRTLVMMHAEIKRNDDPDFKVLTQKMLPELAKLALLKTIVEMLGSLGEKCSFRMLDNRIEISHRNLGVGVADIMYHTPPRQLGGEGRLPTPLSHHCAPPASRPPSEPVCTSNRRPPPRPPRFLTQWSPSRLRAPAPSPSLGEGGEPGGKKSIAPAVGAPALLSLFCPPFSLFLPMPPAPSLEERWGAFYRGFADQRFSFTISQFDYVVLFR
ncbi:hypothetical protein PAPYR_13467 [Paratrimastix pyriformis]|uniref:Uncharacterized protein n=1 Tax=Paratrimastix pyriformis TaxID=342808 RepID=A0ABQ8U069_9EUKA|nr:hypothetical protein PAPYR_13467 [Paratrimastix pyriformis]